MRKNNKLILVLLVLLISIGFAYLSTNLSILGNATIRNNKWHVYFNNLQIIENDSGSTGNATIENDTTVNFSTDLSLPGDYFEFNVDVVNNGTIDAMIDSVTSTINGSPVEEALDSSFEYSLTYSDGSLVKSKQILRHDSTRTYKVKLQYNPKVNKENLIEEDEGLSIEVSINYIQADETALGIKCDSNSNLLYCKMKAAAVEDNIKSANVANNEGIDFTKISSATNGQGIYLKADTKSNDYPIYYYRGEVLDNNVKFANRCWKIVRTTETGGIKLIYNGNYTEENKCDNSQSATEFDFVAFNEERNCPIYVGYMYGTYYPLRIGESEEYAESAIYKDGSYYLGNRSSKLDATHHYACEKSSNSCSTIRYYYYINSETNKYYYIELTKGEMIEDALENMFQNKTNSTIKNYIETTWYPNILGSLTDYLEDTVYCNDRSIYNIAGWDENGELTDAALLFGGYERWNLGKPSLACQRKEDRFTVSKENGNGESKYPIGLLSIDEAMLAGGAIGNENRTFYLYSKQYFRAMSPYYYSFADAHTFGITTYGELKNYNVYNTGASLRPVISLKSNTRIKSGNGHSDNPFILE